MVVRKDLGMEVKHGAIGLFEGDLDCPGLAAGPPAVFEFAVCQCGGPEGGIKRRSDPGSGGQKICQWVHK